MVMIYKDLKEDSAIQKAFPEAQVLYCTWHNENTFKKHFKGDTFECVKQMMLAETEEDFNLFLEKFKILENGNKKKIEYFESNWLNCIEKWTKFKRIGLALNVQETNNPVEVVNKQFKHFSDKKHAQNSLAKCLTSILNYIKSSELNKEVISSVEKRKTVIPQYSDPVINEFFKIVSKSMAKWLVSQYQASIERHYTYIFDKNTSHHIVKIEEKKYSIKDWNSDFVSCSCYEHLSLNLPCLHIFYLYSLHIV